MVGYVCLKDTTPIYCGGLEEHESLTYTKNPAIAIRQNILSHTNGSMSSYDVNGGLCSNYAVARSKQGRNLWR
jgi:hypothetical protein